MKTVLIALTTLILLAPPAHAGITIAAVGPITGQDASLGEQMQRGAEAAVAALNAQGGVLGQKVRLLIKDDVCDPKQAVAIANKLSGENAVAVIGHMCSGSTIPASKVYNDEGILMISPSATSPALTEQGFDNIFRVCGRDDQQGATAADYIAQKYAKANIAIVHDKTAYGQGLADQVQKSLHQHGITEKLYQSISRGERDYSALVSRLKQDNIGIVFFGGYHPEAGLIVRQMRAQGMTTVLIGGDGLTTTEFWSITGAAGEGTLMTFSSDPRTKPEAADAVKQIRATHYEPEGTTLYTYAAVQVWAEAAKRAGTTAITKVTAEMHKTPFPTVLGDIAFTEQGDVTKPDYIIYQWTKGNYVPLQ